MTFKFYNPFKLHIVEHNGLFYVRKLTLFGWRYVDKEYYNIWLKCSYYSSHKTLDCAKITLSQANNIYSKV